MHSYTREKRRQEEKGLGEVKGGFTMRLLINAWYTDIVRGCSHLMVEDWFDLGLPVGNSPREISLVGIGCGCHRRRLLHKRRGRERGHV